MPIAPLSDGRFDRIAKRLIPESLMPAQFFGVVSQGQPGWSPGQRLCYAIFERSFIDLRNGLSTVRTKHKQTLFAEASAWFFDDSDEARYWTYSCMNICETLDRDYDTLQRAMRLLIEDAQTSRTGLLARETRERKPLWIKRPVISRKTRSCYFCETPVCSGDLYIRSGDKAQAKTAHATCVAMKQAA